MTLTTDPRLGLPTVYLVDDEDVVRDALAWLLRSRRLLSEGFASAEGFEAMLAGRQARHQRSNRGGASRPGVREDGSPLGRRAGQRLALAQRVSAAAPCADNAAAWANSISSSGTSRVRRGVQAWASATIAQSSR